MKATKYVASFTVLAALVGGFLLIRPVLGQSEPPQGIILTTGDLPRPYEVLDLVTSYQEFKAISFKGDPLVNCLKGADADLRAKAKAVGASAIIWLRFDFENPSEKEEGRLLAYGTAVRYK